MSPSHIAEIMIKVIVTECLVKDVIQCRSNLHSRSFLLTIPRLRIPHPVRNKHNADWSSSGSVDRETGKRNRYGNIQ